MFIIHILEVTQWRLTDSCHLLEVTQLVNQDIQPLSWGSVSFSLLCNKLPHISWLKVTYVYYRTVSVSQESRYIV